MSFADNFKYQILGERLKNERLRKNLREDVLARGVCLSVKNVREIEDSELCESFYSFAVKVTAAKRVGKYLGLEETDFLETKVAENEDY